MTASTDEVTPTHAAVTRVVIMAVAMFVPMADSMAGRLSMGARTMAVAVSTVVEAMAADAGKRQNGMLSKREWPAAKLPAVFL